MTMSSIDTRVRGTRGLVFWVVFAAVLALFSAAGATCFGCSGGTGSIAEFPPAAFSTTMTDSGAMRVEVRTSPQPPTRGGIDAELTITDAVSGAPLDGLILQIRPWMPVMNHGAIMATVAPEGSGKYLVTEVDLYMAGLWELRTTISGPLSDHVAPQFQIP
jgi:YtkA-like